VHDKQRPCAVAVSLSHDTGMLVRFCTHAVAVETARAGGAKHALVALGTLTLSATSVQDGVGGWMGGTATMRA
jgi:hypothetical protein